MDAHTKDDNKNRMIPNSIAGGHHEVTRSGVRIMQGEQTGDKGGGPGGVRPGPQIDNTRKYRAVVVGFKIKERDRNFWFRSLLRRSSATNSAPSVDIFPPGQPSRHTGIPAEVWGYYYILKIAQY